MAATRIAWRNYIRDVLDFSQDEAQEIVIEQGFSSPAFFARSTRENIDSLVKQINRTVIDPGNDPDTTFSINQAQKIMLYDLCDYCRFIYMVDRQHDPAFGTQANLAKINRYYSHLKNKSNKFEDISEVMPPKFDNKNTVELMESLEQWLKRNRGKGGTLLTYVIREYQNPDDNPTADPGFLMPSVEDEAIRRSLHQEDQFVANNKAVWNMLYSVCHGTDAWPVIKGYKTTENGRQAYLDLVAHYQGEGQLNKRRDSAYRILNTTHYNGKKNFSFEKFAARVLGAFEDLKNCGDGMSEHAKVTKFLSMIKEGPQGAGLDACKTLVRGSQACMQNLRTAINTLQTEDTAQQTHRLTAISGTRALAAVDGGGRNSNRGRGRGRDHDNGGRDRGGRNRNRNQHGRGGGRGRGGSQDHDGTVWSDDGTTILNNGGYSQDTWSRFSDRDRRVVLQARERANSRLMSERDIAELNTLREQNRDRQQSDEPAPTPAPAPSSGNVGSGVRRGRR
ncbi:unnamed protein product [Cylindrotheca closterium]|uniref:Uncharacterized protein n=1 Tax=Cylindrotheca closterium TaxID=2856 RepID=A0AAD2CCL1_9STRA|nr:unnamed protein product [Cylindrotheca closterium]